MKKKKAQQKINVITYDRVAKITHPDACQYCGAKDEELRPYGKNNEWICFECGMSPNNKKTTDKVFGNALNGKHADGKHIR